MSVDRDVDTAMTLAALAAELGPKLDVIEAGAVFAAAEHWPLSDVMPVKRVTGTPSGDVVELGFIRAGDGPVVVIAGTMPVGYADFEAVALDGWRPD